MTGGQSSTPQGRITVLILYRRIGEQIVIGQDIRLSVLDLRGKHIRIGIDAPLKQQVRRAESPPIDKTSPSNDNKKS